MHFAALALLRAPPRLGAHSALVAAPLRRPLAAAAERNRERMLLVHYLKKLAQTVVVLRDGAPFALVAVNSAVPAGSPVRAVEPDFAYLAVVVEQLVPLRKEVVDVRGRGVGTLMTVPWREVHSELHAALAAGVRKLAHEVAPRVRRGHCGHGVVLVERGRPQAESVMVLGHEDDAGNLRRPHGARPLRRIKLLRRDLRRRHVAESPLLPRVGVEAPAYQRDYLAVMVP